MFLTKRQNGNWYIFYNQKNGKRTCISCKTRIKSEALKYLSEFQRQTKEESNNDIKRITLKDFTWEYLKYSEVIHSPKTNYTVKYFVKSLLKYYPSIEVGDLNQKMVLDYIQFRLRTTTPYTAKRELAYLSAMCKWGIINNYLSFNPTSGIKRPKVPEKQPLFLSKQELSTLIDTIDDDDFKDLVLFAVNTGMREGELLSLEWGQIDFKNKLILLNNRKNLTKSKKVRSIPLNEVALNIVSKRFKNRKGNIVFTYNDNPMKQLFVSHKFKKYVRKADINQDLSFHSLRHTFASWLIHNGASIYQVSKLLGHSDIKTTEIYAHLRSEDLQNTVNLLN